MTAWRGDDVTGISPEGTTLPMYSGRKIGSAVPMRDYACHVPDTEWDW